MTHPPPRASITDRPARLGVALLCLALLALPCASRAEPPFDQPSDVITVPEQGDDPALRCTVYPDLIIRESPAPDPWPDDAVLIPGPSAGAPVTCDRARPPNATTLPTEAMFFAGRIGPFLFFDLADPHGASNFIILHAATGKRLHEDGSARVGWVAELSPIGDTLRLRYNRGVNARCSLAAPDPYWCWHGLFRDVRIPRGVFAYEPTVALCRYVYHRDHVPDDNPSILSYDVMLTLDTSGTARVQPLGPIECDPMP